jgi:hypothetical protein
MAECIKCMRLPMLRAQTKKAIFTLVLIQASIVLHEVLHLGWFSTQHYFGYIGALIVLQFVNFYSYIWITTTQPGIIQKIVPSTLIIERKIRNGELVPTNPQKLTYQKPYTDFLHRP